MSIPPIYWIPIGFAVLIVLLAMHLKFSIWLDKRRANRNSNPGK